MKLQRFVVELILDCSYFDRNARNHKVFRYWTRSEFFSFRRKNLENAKKKLKELELTHGSWLISSYLYKEI